MFWADKLAHKIIDTGEYKPYWVDDMFTPSGYAHIGSLRGPLVHDAVYRALVDAGVEATSTYVFNDFDPVDGLPPEFAESQKSSLGLPLRFAPSPVPGFESFAHYFAGDFQQVLRDLGVKAEFYSSWDMYHAGKFNEVIRIALDNAQVIQEIYKRVSGSKKNEMGWLPLQVICEKCSKLGTTRVHSWDGTNVGYTCEPEMVSWATGCGYSGKTSPFDGRGKLPWKVDWAAHWKVMGVTIEGAGKDHSSAGGSRDIAKEECKLVFKYPNPYNIPYEFFLIGGKKMSSSKGLGLKARDLTRILPRPVARFLFIRTDYHQAIEFDPVNTMAIPDLFDEYDRCWNDYNRDADNAFSRAFSMSQIGSLPAKNVIFLARFRDLANLSQLPNVDLWRKLAEIKGASLTDNEKEIAAERLKYVTVWLDNYAPEDFTIHLSVKKIPEVNLSPEQWIFLNKLSVVWKNASDPEKLQSDIFNLAKAEKLDLKSAFKALYTALIDREHGPRAGWLLKKFTVSDVLARLNLNLTQPEGKVPDFIVLKRPDIFTIEPELKKDFPSLSVGIAVIKGVKINNVDTRLESEKSETLKALAGLSTEKLGQYPEITSYRKLYKAMGIDWHSRRPSPEALLRRVVMGKNLYKINTCVDAYNLVVLQDRISVGAFDYDKIKFPTMVKYASPGDKILLLGDKAETVFRDGEIAYYDQTGAYNLDFNYRDAQRTLATENTKNIFINVDGIYDIKPDQVASTLDLATDIIMKYCGGTLDFKGIVG